MTHEEDFFVEVRFSNINSPVIVKIINTFFAESYKLARIISEKPIYVFRFERMHVDDDKTVYSAQFRKSEDKDNADK